METIFSKVISNFLLANFISLNFGLLFFSGFLPMSVITPFLCLCVSLPGNVGFSQGSVFGSLLSDSSISRMLSIISVQCDVFYFF